MILNLGLVLYMAFIARGTNILSTNKHEWSTNSGTRMLTSKKVSILAVLLFSALPTFSSGYSGALTAWILSALLVVGLRLVIHSLIRNHKMLHTLLILGSDELTEQLYKELSSIGAGLDSRELQEMAVREHVSRIVVADPRIDSHDDLTASLIDSKLRGLKIEPAMESSHAAFFAGCLFALAGSGLVTLALLWLLARIDLAPADRK